MADDGMFKVIETDTMTGSQRYLDNMKPDQWTGTFTREQAETTVKWREENITRRYAYKIVPVEIRWRDHETDPSAVLAEFKARNEWRIEYHAYTPWTVEHDVPEGDVRRLLAVADAVLKLADKYDAEPRRLWDQVRDADRRSVVSGSKSIDAAWNGDVARAIRETIARELTGEGNGNAER